MRLLEETQSLARHYHLKPDTSRGQNFLIDESVITDSLRAGALEPDDTVVEIGCGLGTLTKVLARRVKKVVGCESDRRLFTLLDTLTTEYDNLTLIKNDFLKIPADQIYDSLALKRGKHYKVVANIPYYITGQIINHIFSFDVLPSVVILLVQKEVAEKIIAKPGDHSKQSLGIQFYGSPKIARVVSHKAFWPRPAVDSAILVITELHHWSYDVPEDQVWELIRLGFSSRRKTLLNNLSNGLKLSKPMVEEWLLASLLPLKVRAQDLDLEQWVKLAKNSKVKSQK